MGKLIKKIGFELELVVNNHAENEIKNVNDSKMLGLAFSGDGSIETEDSRDCDNCDNDGDYDCNDCEYDGNYGLEIKTSGPMNYTRLIKVSNSLFSVLKKLEKDRDASVNNTCGLHFHFDITNLSVRELRNNHNNWARWGEDWFYQIIKANRRDNNFARSIKGISFSDWLKKNQKYWSASPHFLDVWTIPTIEYRLFHSTLNGSHFLNYLRLIKLFIDSRGNRSEFDTKVGKNKTLIAFCQSMKKEYN